MERQYVGIDLHRRSSTIYRMSAEGEVLGCVRIPSQPMELTQAMTEAGDAPEVVLESTYGWYWAADLLESVRSPTPSTPAWRTTRADEITGPGGHPGTSLFLRGRLTP
jgi:hypothetical protein